MSDVVFVIRRRSALPGERAWVYWQSEPIDPGRWTCRRALAQRYESGQAARAVMRRWPPWPAQYPAPHVARLRAGARGFTHAERLTIDVECLRSCLSVVRVLVHTKADAETIVRVIEDVLRHTPPPTR